MSTLRLLLARADDHRPSLPGELPARALAAASPAPLRPAPAGRRCELAPPDSLPDQRWALVAPRGPRGDRLLRLCEPLRRRREEEQGDDAITYRVDPDMSAGEAARWVQRAYQDAVRREEERLPRYLLLLGGPDEVSWDFQQLLGAEAYVGRLGFDREEGYASYMEKLLAAEREPPEPGAAAMFFAARDGSGATAEATRWLLEPCMEGARRLSARGALAAEAVLAIGEGAASPGEAAGALLREAERRAGVLLSIGHGAGPPRAGWASAEEQRARQGELILGPACAEANGQGGRLGAEELAARAFLPCGAWIHVSCFGAGTPIRSAYAPWLAELRRLGWISAGAPLLEEALPPRGEPPFVSAPAQAALANPRGPLGVIGHVDLAWTFSFLDPDPFAAAPPAHPRVERFLGVLRALAGGHRLGVAHHELARAYRSLSVAAAAQAEDDARRGVALGEEERARRAALWMQRQDLGAYMLLGDPAARLPLMTRPGWAASSRRGGATFGAGRGA